MGVSFDLFGTLVSVEKPADPAAAVARELESRDIDVPVDWGDAYAEVHVDASEGAEVALPTHVSRALESRGIGCDRTTARRAVIAAFESDVESRPNAREAVEAARERGPVAICSNCSVPELVDRTLERAELDRDAFDAVVTSVECGWRKPAPEIFAHTAARLGIDPAALVHVGDDPETDGGIRSVGGTALLLEETSLETISDRLADRSIAQEA